MTAVIHLIDAAISAVDIVVRSLVKLLDRMIVVIQDVSKRIVTLLLALFRLAFYLLPFVLFVSIGHSKHWPLLMYLGLAVLCLVAVLFVRDFLAAFHSSTLAEEPEEKVERTGRVIFIMFILNAVTIVYAVVYYGFNIDLEKMLVLAIQSKFSTPGTVP